MDQLLAAVHEGNPKNLRVSLESGPFQEEVVLAWRFPKELRTLVQQQLFAHYPDCQVQHLAEDVLKAPAALVTWTADLYLSPSIFPCKRYGEFDDSLNHVTADPLASILATIPHGKDTRLRAHLDLSFRPAGSHRIARGKECVRKLASPFFADWPELARFYAVASLSRWRPVRWLAAILGLLARQRERPSYRDPLHSSSSKRHGREVDLQAANDKLGRLLFECRLRLSVSGPASAGSDAKAKLREMAAAFGQFHSSRLTAFRLVPASRSRFLQWLFRSAPFLLSTEEVASLWHPPTQTVRLPALASVTSRLLDPPVRLPLAKDHPDLAVLGVTLGHGRPVRFGILPDDRRRHVAILGKTGMGKSTLLLRLVAADIRAGRGVGLIDPHGDLAEAVLSTIPRERTNDVVLLDAGDRAFPFAFNVLACDRPEQRPLVASGIVAAIRKLYPEFFGPRMEHILRNSLLALLEVPDASLLSLMQLLSDARFRDNVIRKVGDPVVRNFWEKEFAGLPARTQAEAVSPIQNKVGHFLSNPILRNILSQGRGRLDLRQVMDQGQVLIVNLSKGRMGEDASDLLGSLLVHSIQVAAMSRADQPENDRRDFFLYVDEFQSFATESFASILSEARKYRLNLTLAHQYMAQLSPPVAASVFGNVGTLLTFQVGAQDADLLAQQLGGEITPQDLLTLPRYQAYIRLLLDGMPSKPYSMQTLQPPRPGRPESDRPEIIRRYCRQRYSRPVAKVEAEIRKHLA